LLFTPLSLVFKLCSPSKTLFVVPPEIVGTSPALPPLLSSCRLVTLKSAGFRLSGGSWILYLGLASPMKLTPFPMSHFLSLARPSKMKQPLLPFPVRSTSEESVVLPPLPSCRMEAPIVCCDRVFPSAAERSKKSSMAFSLRDGLVLYPTVVLSGRRSIFRCFPFLHHSRSQGSDRYFQSCPRDRGVMRAVFWVPLRPKSFFPPR